jgi:actin-related protein
MIKNPAIIIDNGSKTIKAGLSDGFEYSVSFPSIIGEPKQADMIIGVD